MNKENIDGNNENAEREYDVLEVDVGEGIKHTVKSLGVGDGQGFNGFKNLEELKLPQDFASEVGIKKMLTTIPVKRPDKQKFIRVKPEPSYRMTVATIEVKEENETFIIHPQILSALKGEYNVRLLVVAITRQRVLFVWPLGLPGPDGKDNAWHRSAREAAEHAQRTWVRLVANRELGAYEVYEAEGNLGEPEFPDLTMEEIVKIAFKDKVICDLDHPLLHQLRGR